MFDFFTRRTAKEFMESAKENYTVPESKPKTKEHYRVGFDNNGNTTLTLMSGMNSMTLTMNHDACEQLIRMLRATYPEESVEETNG
jgi:hypothetical protein